MVPEATSVHAGGTSILISHPTGNQNVRNALLAFAEHGMLKEFWTTIACNGESRLCRLLPAGFRSQLVRRAFPEAPVSRTRSAPFREMMRLAIRPTPLARLLSSGERAFSVIGVYRAFDKRVARRLKAADIDTLYAYEGGALETFREAKRLGIGALYELTAAHWDWTRKLLDEEIRHNHDYPASLTQLQDSERHLAEKSEEIQLSDLIFVPSQYVRRSLQGVVADEKIRVIPYGAPAPIARQFRVRDRDLPLRVLFVGMLVQRKGIGYLLDAVDQLGSGVELTLVGRRMASHPRLDHACRQWRWIESLPHDELLDLMVQCDVLVLPSLTDSFGLVVTEALACGLPVIVTPNVGASDLIENGREGFVVPIGSALAIAERLAELSSDRNLLNQMSINAQQTARYWSWERYRAALIEAIAPMQVLSETTQG